MKNILLLAFSILALNAAAQGYKLTFQPQQAAQEGVYFIGQHFRDQFIIMDSTHLKDGSITFVGKKKLTPGVYVLLNSDRKKMFDFMIDGSTKFTVSYDEKYTNSGMRVKGCEANTLMYEYMAKLDWARAKSKEIGKDKSRMDSLSREMEQYEANYFNKNAKYRFTQLVNMFKGVTIPDSLTDNDAKARYYRTHYWEGIDLNDHSLIYTPQLFDKMNYYFFGLLYYQDADTITSSAKRVLDRVVEDSTMLRYFLDFIMPKYERATKNIGWDRVFVNLVEEYYLQGKCPWATEADLYSKRNTIQYLSHSLIGSIGQELFMADTNQSDDPRQWLSSHRFPERYVILWFWDPDCHHCQEQSAELATLVDSLNAIGQKRFEVFAIGYEADVTKWKKYLREHNMPFVNVGGSNVNIDYQEAYNVHGAPTMIILDADRRIIMNKVLPVKNILSFLDNYEKEHPEMATKVSRWMMYQRKTE